MIRRLRLEAWRAFASLDIQLEEGVTLVVAQNGVGKTSLLEAAAWGIYGSRSGVDGASARRKDSNGPAVVTVEVELPNGSQLSITRSTAAPADPLTTLDGRDLSSLRLDDTLKDAFGADPDFLARVTILSTDVLQSYGGESFQLRRHLCRVYGIDALESAASQISRYLSATAKDTKALRTNLQERIRDESSLSEDLSRLQTELHRVDSERSRLQEQIAIGERQATLRTLSIEAEAANHSRSLALSQIADDVDQFGLSAETDSLARILDSEDDRLNSAIDESRRRQSSTQGRLDAVEEALETLRSSDAECPVCRRPLNQDDTEHAESAHGEERAVLMSSLAEYELETERLVVRQREVRALRRKVDAVPPAKEVALAGDHEEPVVLDELYSQSASLSETVGALKTKESELEKVLADSVAARNEQSRAITLYRREAIATATKETLETAVKTLLTTSVEPVAQEVSSRWKRIFGERGALILSPEGELSLSRGGFVVPFEDFSAGEKVVALLTARLLITTASTHASFMWLDEPLEHLDPANRRIVASLLATASAPIRQVVVTTYEEPLARRLAEQIPSVHLTYVRTMDD